MKVLFFEIDAINVKRYYLDVLSNIIENNDITILIENAYEEKVLHSYGLGLEVFCLEKLSKPEFFSLIESQDVIVVNGQRIPDIYVTQVSRVSNTKVIYLQHGLYIPLMKRSLNFYISRLRKTFRYFTYAINAGFLDNNISLFFSLFLSHTYKSVRNYKFKKVNGFPDLSFVVSEYWKHWHKKYYFNEEYDKFVICGNPEILRFQKVDLGEDDVVYCYQTLVEDGRISKEKMLGFIEGLFAWISRNEKNLVVKGHPRMSQKIKEYLHLKGAKLYDGELPVSSVIIGHYSSLLPLWTYYGSNVYSVQLEGHPIEESILKTTTTISKLDEIEIDKNPDQNSLKEKVEYYFNYRNDYSDIVEQNTLELFHEK